MPKAVPVMKEKLLRINPIRNSDWLGFLRQMNSHSATKIGFILNKKRRRISDEKLRVYFQGEKNCETSGTRKP